MQAVKTSTSLKIFMSGLIDYGGLFPPASLPLDRAIQNYAKYRESNEQWMLSRFVIPASQLESLGKIQADIPIRLSILGRSGPDKEAFLANLKEDLRAIQCHAVEADVFEVALPVSVLFSGCTAIEDLLKAIHEQTGDLRVFYEVPAAAGWLEMMSDLVHAIGSFNAVNGTSFGLKLRCGGVSASDIPPSIKLTMALLRCRDAGIALKATAGLHHPIRHFDSSVQTTMHGFINLFGAGILAHVHRLDAATTRSIIDDQQASNFRFREDSFAWHDIAASVDQIAAVRQNSLISFGSCSFEEPIHDLQAMGVL